MWCIKSVWVRDKQPPSMSLRVKKAKYFSLFLRQKTTRDVKGNMPESFKIKPVERSEQRRQFVSSEC